MEWRLLSILWLKIKIALMFKKIGGVKEKKYAIKKELYHVKIRKECIINLVLNFLLFFKTTNYMLHILILIRFKDYKSL